MYSTIHAPRTLTAANSTSFRGTAPLAESTLRSIAPAIFAESPHASRSARYSYIPTAAILERLATGGFRPYSVQVGGTRDEAKRSFTKHLLRLRHDSAADIRSLAIGDSVPEILLLNSHDGTSSHQLSGGIFRLTCLNGMAVAESTMPIVRVPHKGDVAGLVLEGCVEIMEQLPIVGESITAFERLSLSPAERNAFATAALALRYEADETVTNPAAVPGPLRPDQILAAHRREDQSPTLWRTFNTVQENLIGGGVNYLHRDENGRRSRRSTRPVAGIDQNTALNRALWTLAEEMRKIKA